MNVNVKKITLHFGCRKDCVALLSECLDTTRVPAGVTSEQICNKISTAEDEAPCVSVSTYLGQYCYLGHQYCLLVISFSFRFSNAVSFGCESTMRYCYF